MKTIGILETGRPPQAMPDGFGDYPQMMIQLINSGGDSSTFDYKSYAVLDEEFPESADDCDGWLITGSKHGVYDGLPWIEPLKALIRDIYEKEIPLIGICFGHQIVAEALGGKVEKSEKGWGLGPNTYTLKDRPDWMGASSESLTLNAVHQDQILKLPPEASVFASSEFCPNAGLIYAKKAFSLQPHPEFSVGFVEQLVTLRGTDIFPQPYYDTALKTLTEQKSIPDAKHVASWMHHFFSNEG